MIGEVETCPLLANHRLIQRDPGACFLPYNNTLGIDQALLNWEAAATSTTNDACSYLPYLEARCRQPRWHMHKGDIAPTSTHPHNR